MRAFLLSAGPAGGLRREVSGRTPTDHITDANFYQTRRTPFRPHAAYSELQDGQYNYALWAIGDIMSDNSFTGGDDGNDGVEYKQLDTFSIPTTNPVATPLWNGCYMGVAARQPGAAKVPGIPTWTRPLSKRCLGEAQFLRAKYYFDLVRAYGDVPLITTPPTTPASDIRAPRPPRFMPRLRRTCRRHRQPAASYCGADLGRATKWAATGLLAKVYLTEGKMAEAASAAREVSTARGKTLWANYGDNFKVANENGKESLFEVQYMTGRNQYTFDGLGFVGNEFFGPRGQGLVPAGRLRLQHSRSRLRGRLRSRRHAPGRHHLEPGDAYPGRPHPAGLVRARPRLQLRSGLWAVTPTSGIRR